MPTQMEKAELFRALHERPGAFIIPNPWDAGTAKLLAAMGFEALATTSLGLANMLGSAKVSRDAILENCRAIAQATELPVNADLENCGADAPKAAAETIRLAAEAGAVGLRRDPAGLHVVGDSGHLTIPEVLRRRYGLAPGTRVLLAGNPDAQLLAVCAMAVVDQVIRAQMSLPAGEDGVP